MTVVDDNRLKGNYAQGIISAWLGKTCLVRPVSEGTDIGVDLYCESIVDGEPFLHFWAQVKAIPANSIVTEDGTRYAHYRFERKHLVYWNRQPIPVYAFLVPLEGWPSVAPHEVFSIRITERNVRSGVPESATTVYRTSDSFEVASLDQDLKQFVTAIVPWDTSAMLLKRGIVAPMPKVELGGDEAFPTQIGFQYLPQILTTMRDASVHGLFHALLGERLQPQLRLIRDRFQHLAEFFEQDMHDWGLSMLVRAAHTDGDVERAKGYVHRAIARIAVDESAPEAARRARIAKLSILLEDFE